MADQTPEEPKIITRLDGEEFVEALSRLADALGTLLVTVTAFELRLAALEGKGKDKGKGFNQL